MSKVTTFPARGEAGKSQPTDPTGPIPTNVLAVVVRKPLADALPPRRGRFVAKCDREVIAASWLSGRASMMRLVRSNRGLSLLDVEDVVRDFVSERLRRSQVASFIARKVA